MRRVYAIWLGIVLAVMLLAGCQATPDEPVVLQKDLEQMIEKGMAQSESATPMPDDTGLDYAALCAHYGVPERFETTITEGKLAISCDVAVELPQTIGLSMARVKSGGFTQEQVSAFWDALVGDTPMYMIPEQPDKEYYQQEILALQAQLAAETDERIISAMNYTIAFLEESYLSAPDHNELIPADDTLQTEEIHENNINESIGSHAYIRASSAPNEAGAMTFYVYNDAENTNAGVYSGRDEQGNTYTLAPSSRATLGFERNGVDYSMYWNEPFTDVTALSLSGGAADDCGLSATPAQARETVENFLAQMGIDDMMIDAAYLCEGRVYTAMNAADVSGPGPQAYVFRVLRQLDGAKVESTHSSSQTRMEMAAGEESIAVGKEWYYEYMFVAVDDEGIADMCWQAPLEVTEVLTENTAIRPWSEIESVFEKMLVIKNADYESIDSYKAVQIDVSHVSLSLQRVMERDSFTTGLLVPVWNFYGTTTLFEQEREPFVIESYYTPLISINAIDGSVVDVSMGY
jgi:hypothetical protein